MARLSPLAHLADEDADAVVPFDAIAVDGKAVYAERLVEGRRMHLLSPMTVSGDAIIVRCNVDRNTNEIARFRPPPQSHHRLS